MNPLLAYRNDSPLSTGLRLLLANRRLLLWTYLASVLLGLRAALPFHARISPILDHSLAAQDLAGRFDVSSYALLTMHLGKQGTSLYTQAFAAVAVYCVFAVLLAAGTYFVFGSGESPRLAIVLRAGVDYFWRFFRLLLFAGIIGGTIVGGLAALRTVVLKHADEVYVEQTYFVLALTSFIAVALVAFFFRLWFDLAEATIIQLGLDGDRRVRRSLFPSLRILKRRFASTYLSYLLIGVLGWAGLLLCVWLWVVVVPARAVPLAWIVGQLGVLSILTARIWQRGLATAVVAFADPVPVVHPAIFTPPPTFQPAETGDEGYAGTPRTPEEISSSEVAASNEEAIGEPRTTIDPAPHPIDGKDTQT